METKKASDNLSFLSRLEDEAMERNGETVQAKPTEPVKKCSIRGCNMPATVGTMCSWCDKKVESFLEMPKG